MKKKSAESKDSRINKTGANLLSSIDEISEIDQRRFKRINDILQVIDERGVDQIASVAIDVDLISCDQNNRIEINSNWDEFEKLKQSISKDGLINPPIVFINEDRSKIVCLAGHLRLAALKDLGITSVNCKYIHRPDNYKKQRIQLLENIARKNIHPIELAESLHQMEISGLSPEQISKDSAIHLQTVRNYLNIGRWSLQTRKIIHQNMEIFSKKSKALQKLGWKAKKLDWGEEEISNELSKFIAPAIKPRQGGSHFRKREKAKKIITHQKFSQDEIAIITKFLVQYDGIDLNNSQ